MSVLPLLPAEASAQSRSRPIGPLLVIVNPASRSALHAVEPVVLAARRAGVAVDRVETRCPGDATRIVHEYIEHNSQAYSAVFVVGGDGTAMEAATALAALPDAPPLGIIAGGTANVFARTLGISLSAETAMYSLLDAEVVTIDLGRVLGGPMFAIGLGVGLDASMIAGTSPTLKRRLGYVAYALSALRAGLRLEKFNARVTVDGVVHEARTSSVLVANFGTVLADLVCFGEDTGPQDGMLDVCFYSPRSIVDASRIFLRMLFGGVKADRCVRIIRGRHIRIESDPPRPAQADGELLGLTPISIAVLPSALKVLVPRAVGRRWRFRRQPVTGIRVHELAGATT